MGFKVYSIYKSTFHERDDHYAALRLNNALFKDLQITARNSIFKNKPKSTLLEECPYSINDFLLGRSQS